MRLPALIASLALVLPSVLISQAQRVVGYYGKTAGDCPDYPSFAPAQLPYDLYTHLNFAFVMINDDGVVEMQHPEDVQLYKELNDLKIKKPSLRTAVTVGGWDMDMAHYSKMVSTPANRQKFIKSAISFVRQHGKEMRDAANSEELEGGQERLILSIALPGGPFHGRYFTVPKLADYVDWFNIMAYNLHGQWEDMVFCAAPLYDTAAHTKYNGYSVDDAAKSMAPRTVNPKKFNLGLSLSGVTFTLKDPKKTSPGSPAGGPGKQGCQEKGAMAYFEARKLANNLHIADVKARAFDQFHRTVTQEPKMDPVGKCMYMVVDENQWVGYDTPETYALKIDYLKKYGFGGVSIWSMDSDSANHELTTSIHKALTKDFIQGSSVKGGGSDSDDDSSDSIETDDITGKGKKKTSGGSGRSAREIASSAVKMLALLAFAIVVIA
ncbi:hypothetical protein BGZ83_005624 [Gryganskiella cystojenkinii]|nr:hypothetical protein BGZ83_005624 [Gryganskiella cystojenkinii]